MYAGKLDMFHNRRNKCMITVADRICLTLGCMTQETVDQCIVQAKEELEAIKNGALVSRTIDGENNPNFGITINNLNSDVDVAYTTTIMDQKGQEINLGSFPTEEERSTAIRNYCDEQIKLGNMTKEYAENLINELQ